jgi:hypothetical protein
VRIIGLGLVLLVAVGCGRIGDDATVAPQAPGTVDAAAGAQTPEPQRFVVLRPDGKPEARVKVRVARTDQQRRRGLMYVQSLPPDEGMIFLFDEDEVQGFYMKNTLIPLDMIFIDKERVVVGIVENAEPLTLDTRGVDRPSRYVLEVNGGWAHKHGVTAGTKVEFEGI